MWTQNKIAKFIIKISLYKQTSMDLAAYETRIIRKARSFLHIKRAEKERSCFSPQNSNQNCFPYIGSLSISQTPSYPSSCFSSQKHQTSRARKWIRGNLINLFIYSLQ